MGTNQDLEAALIDELEPGERVHAWRTVVANGRVDDGDFETNLALLGPAVYAGAAAGTVTADRMVPKSTNLVVITDRRILWCRKPRFSGAPELLGADSLATVGSVEVDPARIALAKLRITFHDRTVARFDLPTDHKVDEFLTSTLGIIGTATVAA